MTTSVTWFDSDDLLARELRRFRAGAHDTPTIAGYAELRELRRGGQGIVYLGTQLSTRRQVAIKILLDGALASQSARRRFEREIDLIANLRHPNIVRVFDSGVTHDGRLYYIMDYIEGAGLDELLAPKRSEPTSPATAPPISDVLNSEKSALSLFVKICDAVHYAHQRGVIHRDIKPSNVRIDPAGEPHVLDFGLAKLIDAPDATQVSQAGGFMGSLPWASPEQADGNPTRIDVRTDVYSLGVLLYQMLTGEFPYPVSGSLRDVLEHIMRTEPRRPSEIRRGLGDDISTVALTCLAKESERRYQSAGELARDVRHVLENEPIEAKRTTTWYSVRKTLKRYQTAVTVTATLLCLSLAFGVAMVWLWGRAVDAERLATKQLAETQLARKSEEKAHEATKAQISKTRKVATFLDSTMRSVDPWKHPGRDLGPMRELLDTAVTRLGGAFPDQPTVEAELAGTLGWDYWKLGLYDSAETLLRRSYRLFRGTLGAEATESLSALNNLAMLLTEQGKHAESAELFGELLTRQCKLNGADDRATLVAINNMALNLDWLGQSEQAESLYRDALESQTRILGPFDLSRLDTLNNLAACLPGIGKMTEAEALYQELIVCRSATQGPSHPETLRARMNYADFVNQAGRLGDAETLLRDVLVEAQGTVGTQHPLTTAAMHNLADVLASLGKRDEALDLARRSYDAQLALAGAEHPTTLLRKNEYVTALADLKRWKEAIPLARELLVQYGRALGADDSRTLNAAGNLAYALNQIGQHDEAEKTWTAIVATAEPKLGAAAAVVVNARANLGALYCEERRWSDAERAFRLAIEAQRANQQAGHWRTAWMEAGLGRVLTETGRFQEAESVLTPAYHLLQKALGPEHEKTRRAGEYVSRLNEKRRLAEQSKGSPPSAPLELAVP